MADRAVAPLAAGVGARGTRAAAAGQRPQRAPSRGAGARVSASGSRPLDGPTRTFFESRFGADFGDVRVHTGGDAARSAESIGARAYTLGRDIVFGAGEYSPRSADGRRLLAHELAHAMQPDPGPQPTLRRKVRVKSGVTLDTEGFAVKKEGDVYVGAAKTTSSPRNEVFSGLFESPRVFAVKGVTSAAANANLHAHLKARLGILSFASKKRYAFAAGVDFKMNPAYWTVGGPHGYERKPEVDVGEAIDDLNVNPQKYEIACLAATTLTMVGGARSLLKEEPTSSDTDWIPGDWGNIMNTKFVRGTDPVGNEGENIIYTGKGMYWGHWPGEMYKSYDTWFKQVEGWNGGAALKPARRRPMVGLE
jgi:hypothetical protein